MTTAEQAVARALASAFLSGDWSQPALLDRGRLAMGARPRWLNPLVRAVLELYREPPRDRPRELAAVISAAPPFERAVDRARRQGRTLRVVEIPPAPTRMARTRWPVAPIDDLGVLAERLHLDADRLAWFADTQRRQRRAPAGPLHHYRYRWIPRPGRLPRLLEAPLPRLLAVQRRLLAEVIGMLPTHPAAHGFVPGRSVRTAAGPHVGADVVLRLDLAAFFASVRAGRVYGVLRSAGYPEPVAHVLTGLCTTATPVGVIAAMPPGGGADERFALRRLLARAHLPQGAAGSPALANLTCYRLDARLAGYAAAAGAAYTRYADDLVFSGGPAVTRATAALTAAVTRIVSEEGFTVNPGKTRVRGRSQRQHLLGMVVNERLTVPRDEYDRLRAVLHNAVRTGGPQQNRDARPDFRAHLAGRVAWVESLDPARGARLRADLERISW